MGPAVIAEKALPCKTSLRQDLDQRPPETRKMAPVM